MTNDRLFGWRQAFDHPVTLWITLAAAGAVLLGFAAIGLLSALGRVKEPLRSELWKRTGSWALMAPLIVGPVLLGAAWHMGAVALLALVCYGEYARATGLFREKIVSAAVVAGILAVMFAALDHWYGFFVALFPLGATLVAAASIVPDRPRGYLQRVALGVLAFMLFGAGLGHLAYMGNDLHYRPIVLLLLLGAQMNDVFAFVVGKTLGRRKLAPETSPNKTAAGAAGALVLTTLLVASIGKAVFRDTELDHPAALLLLGAVVSITGQLGDLMMSSIKRDLGLKDMGALIPGHGGVLDRANSLLLSAPAVFHFVGYFNGFGLDLPTRILTGP